MSNKIITLSGAATDVLYALFFRGALLSGDLPSKSGAAELRELGFAETRHTATEYQKENYFTFMTAEGQAFAIEHLVNTRFGAKQYRSAINIGVELDTSDAQKALDELDDKIRNSDAFNALNGGWSFEKSGVLIVNNGQVFVNDAMMDGASIEKAKIGNALASEGKVSTPYVMKIGIERGTDANVEAILNNALKNAAQSAAHDGARRAAEDLKSKTKDIQLAMLYNGEHFSGFGLAVDGQLLSDQLDAKVLQSVGGQTPAELQVTFRLKEKSTGKPIRIDLAGLRNSRGW